MCCSKPNKSKSGYQNKTQNKFLSEEDVDDSSCVNLTNSFFFMSVIYNHKLKVEPFKITLDIEGIPITFEIDTGSLFSIISEKTYNSCFRTNVIEKNDIVLSEYVGNKITSVGKTKLAVTHENEVAQI